MKRTDRQRQGQSAFELIEEAVHLLRTCPAGTLVAYYIGSLPFILGLLYFWTDMSRSPLAGQHLAEAALGLAGSFLWMKTWQAIFARRLLAGLMGQSPALDWRACLRIGVVQSTLQPTALFLLPLSAIPMLPLAWVYAFYQNLTVFGSDESGRLRAVIQRVFRQCGFWPRQNHVLLTVLFGFGLFVFLNWGSAMLLAPALLKILFGVETMFTRNMPAMLNTTFFAIAAGLTYLCVDPIFKTCYVLRCFYGEALSSGADLRAELRELSPKWQPLVLALLLGVCFGAMGQEAPSPEASAGAAPKPAAAETAGAIAPAELDGAIRDVLKARKYTWRAPRERVEKAEKQKGIIGRFLERAGKALKDWFVSVVKWIDRMLRKLFQPRGAVGPGGEGYGWMILLHLLFYLLLAAAVVCIFWLLWRALRRRQAEQLVQAAEPIQPAPDLNDEDLGAEQLPEDGWTSLGHELLGRGEWRLALRAFYLASLAHLSERNLITLARFKSNRDYQRELQRRGHSWPELLAIFGDNVAVFDRSWYGLHPVDGELVNQFAGNVQKMRGTASTGS